MQLFQEHSHKENSGSILNTSTVAAPYLITYLIIQHLCSEILTSWF